MSGDGGFDTIHTNLRLSKEVNPCRGCYRVIALCRFRHGSASQFRGVLLENMVQDVWRIKGQITGESVGKSEFIHLALWLIMCHHSIVFLLDAWNVQHI